MFLLILAVFAGLIWYWNTQLIVEEIEITSRRLPQSFDGFRVAVVSDLHAAVFGKDNEKLYDAVREAKPDIIALTGDITDAERQVDGVIKTVAELVKIAPVYYVTGNHEWEKGGVQELFRRLPEVGATVLRNEILPVEHGGETIYIVGLEDPNGPSDMKTPAEVFALLPDKDAFNVTLVHRNTLIGEIAPLGTDLIVCGHGHGGLVRLPFLGGLFDHDFRFFPKYTSGYYNVGTDVIVSRGIGNNTGIPRIYNNPHIPVAILRAG